MSSTANHYRDYVLPAFDEYRQAEDDLTKAATENGDREAAGRAALRRAVALAVCIDGLRDRWHIEAKITKHEVDKAIAPLCAFQEGGSPREGCILRVRAVANAHKHSIVDDLKLPIASMDHVVDIGSGWGQDGFGVPKWSGIPEVISTDRTGQAWCFRGDALCAVRAWASLLTTAGHDVETRALR